MQTAFIDLDGTLLSCSSEKEFLKYLLKTGKIEKRRLLSFVLTYCKHPVVSVRSGKGWNRSYLRGLDESIMRETAGKFAKEKLLRKLRPEMSEELAEMKNSCIKTVIISAALSYFVEPLGKLLFFDEVISSIPFSDGGILNGKLKGPRPWGREKSILAAQYAERMDLSLSDCVAYGDSWADRFLLSSCGKAVAVHPDRKLFKMAKRNNWRIIPGKRTKWA